MITQNKIPICRECNAKFKDWKELAQHIIQEKRSHKNRKSRIWASKVLCEKKNKQEFKQVADDPDKEKTELGDENRENRTMQLSGNFRAVLCYCPKCQTPFQTKLEEEYLALDNIWTIKNKPAILCEYCRR